MKRIAILLFCIALNFCCINSSIYASNSSYGKIIMSGAYLYRSNTITSNYSSAYFELENTYFVQILFEDDKTYKVSYNGLIGYVDKNVVKRILGTPQNPYPDNIKLVTNKNCYLRSTPTQSDYGNDIMLISSNTSIDFIGRIKATSIEDFGDTTWYYVKVNDMYGYIHCSYLKSQATIYPNTEQITYVNSNVDVINPLSDTTITVLICILMTPAIAILYLMYHKPKSKHKIKTKIKYEENL